MIIAHAATAKRAGTSEHRTGGIDFTILLEGREHSVDNFMLGLVRIGDAFSTPRHRHNFEQVRIMLEGGMSFGPGQMQEAGSVGYFSEGTYYTQQGVGMSTTLLLQVAGPSGDGYMSRAQLDSGIAVLKQKGEFARGVYTWVDPAGQKHNKDGYEAVWEHVFGRPLGYEPPRYDAPVMVWPDRFNYLPDPAQPGVALRRLGVFHERGLTVAQARVNAGASWRLDGAERPWLIYALTGEGTAEREPFGPQSAFMVERNEMVRVDATTGCEFYVLGLPVFDATDLPAALARRELAAAT